jgi:tRNA uridine 5-carboxymethylaminomethyl modification enzyme
LFKIISLSTSFNLKQAEITEIRFKEGADGKKEVESVVTHLGAVYPVKAAIVATGTYLKGRVLIGEVNFPSGPDGLFPSINLSKSLKTASE